MTEKRVCERERDIIGDRLWYELYCFVFVYQNKNKSLLFPTKIRKLHYAIWLICVFFFGLNLNIWAYLLFFFFLILRKSSK